MPPSAAPLHVRFTKRIELARWAFVWIGATTLVALGDAALLRDVWRGLPLAGAADLAFAAAVPLLMVAVTVLLLAPLISHRWGRAVLAILLPINALVAFLLTSLGATVNRGTIDSALETSPRELLHLLTPGAWLAILLTGVLPALLLKLVRVCRAATPRGGLRDALVAPLLAIIVIAGLAAGFYREFAALGARDHQLVNRLVPANYLVGVSLRLYERWQRPNTFLDLTADVTARTDVAPARTLLVIVVGETARARNFSLYGHAQDTNPEMRARNVVALKSATACDTVTVYSVPCMFSVMTRAHFNAVQAGFQSNLLDFIAQSGVHVEWLDNDAGCKGVCARVATHEITPQNAARWCHGGECLDEALLDAFDARLAESSPGSRVLVLHTMGSHGPNYFARYPASYRRFTPTCDEDDMHRCSHEALSNAYSNTIAYTDHIVAMLVDRLHQAEARGQYDAAALIYVSDHGESLGENGIYLHGIPRSVAPREQTDIPFIVWPSDGLKRRFGLDERCLHDQGERGGYSHDNLFHTALGVLAITASRYRPDLNFFYPCEHPGFEAH